MLICQTDYFELPFGLFLMCFLLGLAFVRGLHAQRFPQDSWEAVGIVFLGRFCHLGTNGRLDSHGISLCATPTPSHSWAQRL